MQTKNVLGRWWPVFAGLAGFLYSQPGRADLTQDLNNVVLRYLDERSIPGVQVGVWRGGSQIVDIEAGVSDLLTGAPMNANNHYKIGSVTKSFTVTRILQLADAGRLNLNDPISQYVPGVQNGSATLRQLANMTSGIFNYTEDAAFLTTAGTHPETVWTDAQLVAYADRNAPYYDPGTGPWKYSNTSTVLLGMVVEQVTGNSLQQEITDHLITPLGLTATTYPNPATRKLPEPSLHGYVLDGLNYEDVSIFFTASAFSGSGAMFSTINDLHVWGEALGKGTLLSPEMQLERLNDRVDAGQIPGGPYYDAYGLGLGFIDGWIGHTGDLPGYQDLVLYDPLGDQTIVIAVNLSDDTNIPTEMFLDMQPFLQVPEPSPWVLVGVAAMAIFAWRRNIFPGRNR